MLKCMWKTVNTLLSHHLFGDMSITVFLRDFLRTSPATIMRMMFRIFGDQNFLSLLCYLDDVLVFAPDEELGLKRLELVFEGLKSHNLKLAPRKSNFMQRSVKFLGHVVSETSDPASCLRP